MIRNVYSSIHFWLPATNAIHFSVLFPFLNILLGSWGQYSSFSIIWLINLPPLKRRKSFANVVLEPYTLDASM